MPNTTEARQQANRKILQLLEKMVEKYPDWRFHQILDNVNITAAAEDRFYEESVDTLKRMKTAQFDIK